MDGWGALVLPLLIFAQSVYVKVLANTFLTAALVTSITLLLAFPYAYLMTLATPNWRTVMLVLVLVPFWTSILVRSFALVLLLRDTGVLNSLAQDAGLIDQPVTIIRTMGGVVFGMVQVALPFAVLPIYATMRTIDRRLLQAAEGLGDRPSGAFLRVFVPLSLPGVAAAVLLTFVQALGYYITPALLGGPKNTMIGELIVQQVSTVLRFGFAAALATMLLVTTFVLIAIASKYFDLQKHLMGRS